MFAVLPCSLALLALDAAMDLGGAVARKETRETIFEGSGGELAKLRKY